MPVLRYRNREGELAEVLLDLHKGGDGKTAPLTIGTAPESEDHVHLPDVSFQARIVGSGKARAYAFVLGGPSVRINGRSIEGLRVLRHGDRIQLGDTELMYLDFAPRLLADGSELIRQKQKCSLPSCPDGALAANDEVITCPWCGLAYHAPCWLQLERCATQNCYPVQRMLLAELAEHVKLEKMEEKPNIASRLCVARCERNEPIKPGEEIIHCPECGAPYHPGCWLSMRGPCPECGYDIPGLLDQLVFRVEQRNRQ